MVRKPRGNFSIFSCLSTISKGDELFQILLVCNGPVRDSSALSAAVIQVVLWPVIDEGKTPEISCHSPENNFRRAGISEISVALVRLLPGCLSCFNKRKTVGL